MNATPMDLSQPPMQEFSWDTTLKDVLLSVYAISSELTGNEPRCLRLTADRVQVNWQQSGLVDGSEQSVIEMAFTCRPVEPGSVVLNIPEIVAPTITALAPDTGPASTDIPILTITGTGFNSGSVIHFGTALVNPEVINSGELQCHIGAVNVEFPGTIQVSVVNSDGQASGQLPFTVT